MVCKIHLSQVIGVTAFLNRHFPFRCLLRPFSLSNSHALLGHMSIQDTLNDFMGYTLSVGRVALLLELSQ